MLSQRPCRADLAFVSYAWSGFIFQESVVSQFHDLQMTGITGDSIDFSQFKGRKCLVVNVASQ